MIIDVKHFDLKKHANVVINPAKPEGKSDLDCASDVLSYLSLQFITQTPVVELLKGADIVGNLRFSRPTAYIFPGGDGDSALFAVDGFYLLLDGGFQRKPPCWDFVRHLDRIDSFLITRIGNANVLGVSSFLKRKAIVQEGLKPTFPKIGHAFGNFPTGVMGETTAMQKDSNPLLVNIFALGTEMRHNLLDIGLQPQPCLSQGDGKTLESIILYQKLGYGCLEMFVLNPTKDSKELKEFFHHWEQNVAHGSKSGGGHQVATGIPPLPLSDLVSIAVLIVWRPADPDDSITRVLYPGGCPQDKLFVALEKLKHLRYLQFSNCSEATLFTPKTPGTTAAAKGTPRATVGVGKSLPAHSTPTHKPAPPVNYVTSAATANRRASPVGQAKSPSPAEPIPAVSSRPTTLPSPPGSRLGATASSEIHKEMQRQSPSSANKQREAKTPPSSPSEEKTLPKVTPTSPAENGAFGGAEISPVHSGGEKVETPSSIPSPAADLKNQIIAEVQRQVESSESPKIVQLVQTPEDTLSFKPISPGTPVSPDTAAAKMGEILTGRTPIDPHPPVQLPSPAEFKPVEKPQESPKLSPRSPARSPIDPKLSPLSPFAPEFVPRNAQKSPQTVGKESPSVSPRTSDVHPDLFRGPTEVDKISPLEESVRVTGYDNQAFRDKDEISPRSPADDSFHLQDAHHNGHSDGGGPASVSVEEKFDEISSLLGNMSIASLGKVESPRDFQRDPLLFTGQSSPGAPTAYTPSPEGNLSGDDFHRRTGDGMSHSGSGEECKAPADPTVVPESPVVSPTSEAAMSRTYTCEKSNVMMEDPFSSTTTWEATEPSQTVVTPPSEPRHSTHDGDIDELKQLWGQPLGLPAPPGTTRPTAAATTTNGGKPAAKPAANGTAAAAATKPAAKPAAPTSKPATTRPAAGTKPTANSSTLASNTSRPASAAAGLAKKPATGPLAAAKPPPPGKSPNTAAPSKNTSTGSKPPADPTKTAAKPAAKPAAPKTTATSAAPLKKLFVPSNPFYFDLVYLPHNGNPNYVGVDFFKYIRAKHYVLSGLYPDKEVLDALLTGKKSWNTADEVTLIPTVDSETLTLWMSLHKVRYSCSSCLMTGFF